MSEPESADAADEVLSDLVAFVAAVDGGKFTRARELAARILAVEPENELIVKYTEVLRGREDEEESSEAEDEEDSGEDESGEEDSDGTDNAFDDGGAVEGGEGDGGAADAGAEGGDVDDDRACAGSGGAAPEEEPTHASKIRRSIAQAQALDAELNA